jgi:CubicO group peptidase (beta-lactamase class C family)
MMLVLATEHVTGMRWQEYFNERVWSKIGANGQFICGLAEGVPLAAGLHNCTPEDLLRFALLFTPSWNAVASEQIVSDDVLKAIQDLGNHKAYKGSTEEQYGTEWFEEVPEKNTAQWDHYFPDGAMFKHGNMGQGIYVDPNRDFCGMYFGLAPNSNAISGIDHSPGYLRNAAKMLAGK